MHFLLFTLFTLPLITYAQTDGCSVILPQPAEINCYTFLSGPTTNLYNASISHYTGETCTDLDVAPNSDYSVNVLQFFSNVTCYPEEIAKVAKDAGFDGAIYLHFRDSGGPAHSTWLTNTAPIPIYAIWDKFPMANYWESLNLIAEQSYFTTAGFYVEYTFAIIMLFVANSIRALLVLKKSIWNELFSLKKSLVFAVIVCEVISILTGYLICLDFQGFIHVLPGSVWGFANIFSYMFEWIGTYCIANRLAYVRANALGSEESMFQKCTKYFTGIILALLVFTTLYILTGSIDRTLAGSTAALFPLFIFSSFVFTLWFSIYFIHQKGSILKSLQAVENEAKHDSLRRMAILLYLSGVTMLISLFNLLIQGTLVVVLETGMPVFIQATIYFFYWLVGIFQLESLNSKPNKYCPNFVGKLDTIWFKYSFIESKTPSEQKSAEKSNSNTSQHGSDNNK